jgi:AraC-like DNA-binding protein
MRINSIYIQIGVSILVSLYFLLQINFSKQELIDKKQFSFVTYDDSGTGGISESSLSYSNAMVCLHYTLKPSQDQYAGLKISPKDSSKFIEIEDYDQISIVLQTTSSRRLGIFQVTKVSSSLAKNQKHPYMGVAEFDTGSNSSTVNLNDLTTPEWWYRKNNIKDNQDENRTKEQTLSFNIQDDAMAKDGVPESICINSVYLSKNNTPFILYSIFFPVLINMVFFTVKRFKKPKKVIVNYVATENTENITVDVSEKNLKLLVEFIAVNYVTPDLDLRLIRKKIGITEQSVSQILKNNFGLSYVDYLQNIRIQEAKRLFDQGNTYIAEVAYKVGFGHISSFNRIFKKIVGQTPTEYIQRGSDSVK